MAKTPYDPPVKESFGVASRGEGKTPQIRHTRPEVARHCARMIIAHNGDTRAAVSKMLAVEYPDATEAQIEALARTIQASPHVQREIDNVLEEIGFGKEALKKLIGILWKEVLGGNDKRWASAARLLAEITGAAKAADKDPKLPTLKLAGMEEGLSQMLGDAAPTNEDYVAPELAVPSLDTIESDGSDTDDDTGEDDAS
jgi:hypothetical protein